MLPASNNIMYDRRVVRGNTYAAQVVTQSAQRETARLRQEHERRMRLEALRRRQVKGVLRKVISWVLLFIEQMGALSFSIFLVISSTKFSKRTFSGVTPDSNVHFLFLFVRWCRLND